MKLRLRYAKRGGLRFTSHRDIARAFERAVRRARIPIAYSLGFSPHPKISWVGAAPTGVASEAEYVELHLIEQVDPDQVVSDLNGALPDGLRVLEAVVARHGSLSDRIEASTWRIELPGVDPTVLRQAAAALLASETVEVARMTKNGMRTMDVRPAVVSAQVDDPAGPASRETQPEATTSDEPCGILLVVVRQTTPTVRPDDVLSALRLVADLVPPVSAKAIRMAQGRLDDGGELIDPLLVDRAVGHGEVAEQR